jgi:hypothetical protein
MIENVRYISTILSASHCFALNNRKLVLFNYKHRASTKVDVYTFNPLCKPSQIMYVACFILVTVTQKIALLLSK